jgi:hypothetical protein
VNLPAKSLFCKIGEEQEMWCLSLNEQICATGQNGAGVIQLLLKDAMVVACTGSAAVPE